MLLFKYSSADGAHGILRSGSLYHTHPSLFDDPFDSRFRATDGLDLAKIDDELLALSLRILGGTERRRPTRPSEMYSFLESFHETGVDPLELVKNYRANAPVSRNEPEFCSMMNEPWYERCLRSVRVCCLCETATDSPMWCHYADEFRGAVLGFTAQASDSIFRQFHPVKYCDQAPQLFNEKEWAEIVMGLADTDPTKAIRSMFMKSTRWSLQREHRRAREFPISPSADEPLRVLVPFEPSELAVVFLGHQMPIEQERAIRSLIADRFPASRVAKVSVPRTGYELQVVPPEARAMFVR